MSDRALFLFLLLLPAGAAAQAPEQVLERRIANLAAREVRLQAAAASRDTQSWARQRFVPIGAPPLTLLVPEWAAPAAAPRITALVDSWTVRTGALFTGAPAETIRVAVRSDTSGWSHQQVEAMLEQFPLAILVRGRQEAQRRVAHRAGEGILAWAGGALPLSNGTRERREAILTLAGDTTGVGNRCLTGDASACAAVLRRDSWTILSVRRSLLAQTLDRAGTAGWATLLRDTLAAPESRIGAVTGGGYDVAIEAWVQDLRVAQPREASDPWLLPLAAVWSLIFLVLFGWRLRWHRA